MRTKKLSPRTVETISKPGRHSDGGGLYLVVDQSGARRWLYMFRRDGKLKEMGLGGYPGVTLANARERAQAAREVRADGLNPIEERRAVKRREVQTFGVVADQYVKDLSPQWRSEKHVYQWTTTLTVDAAALRPIPVDAVSTDDVLGVLREIWTTKPETASRLRGRIERVLDAAKAKGLRSGENPARWRGHLDHLLPKRQKLTRGHHAALPYAEMPDFVSDLRKRDGSAALALELLILTATRTGEVRDATWDEFDLKAKVWTIPALRMKAGKPHRVPLTAEALAVLAKAPAGGKLVFKGTALKGKAATNEERPLSNGAMERVLDRMKIAATVHGFRSTFRDWAGETTTFPREIAEAALAHSVGDEVERAYRRGDALEKRRKMMEAWALYCSLPMASNVRPMVRPG
jgi:integrase